MPIPYRPVSQKQLLQERFAEEARADRQKKSQERRVAITEAAEAKNKDAMLERMSSLKVNTNARSQKYATFTENVRIALFEHAIYKVFYEAMTKVEANLDRKIMSEGVMHALAYTFIHENNGPAPLMANMNNRGNTSYFLSEMKKIVDKNFKAVLESINKDDPDSFNISSDIMQGFKDEISTHVEYCDVTDSIADRVTSAITDFFETNASDKEKIVAALTATKEKIDSLKTDDESLKESYARLGRRYVMDIRNKPKTVFAEMVHIMAESVIKNDDLKEEFMTEDNHIDVERLVNKVSMMYGFLETVNTMRLIRVDDKYVQSVLESMRLGE